MSAAKLALDPLWQCLCPAWTAHLPILHTTRRVALRKQHPLPSLRPVAFARAKSNYAADYWARHSRDDGTVDTVLSPLAATSPYHEQPRRRRTKRNETDREISQLGEQPDTVSDKLKALRREPTDSLYGALRANAIDGKVLLCREIARILVEERKERPNQPMYNALILSNVHNKAGSAWRVAELLDEMRDDGLEPDAQTYHAALKVLSVHVDHLLRTDILERMSRCWIQLTEDGHHDVVAGFLREGLFEQALNSLDHMREAEIQVRPWLLDMAVYVLCEANEIAEAYRIMRQRFDDPFGQGTINRSLWSFFLDKASSARHHAATSLAWSNQVMQKYINAPSGVCLNVLATAARAADAVMATEVFTHLSARGTPFLPVHYELLITTYLAADPPDLTRAVTVLSIMVGEKVHPTALETRPFYLYLRDKPDLLPSVLEILRDLQNRGRIIPIAALNVVIECHLENSNLVAALRTYKQIHTFVPLSAGVQKTFADVETFNLLLKGCRETEPPDTDQAAFLMSEMLALGVQPTAMTYDRLLLVFTKAAQHAAQVASSTEAVPGLEYLDKAFEQFTAMQAQNMVPRFGTVESLSIALASVGDARCWDVLQAGNDRGVGDDSVSTDYRGIEGWGFKGQYVRSQVEEAWSKAIADGRVNAKGAARDEEMLSNNA